MRLLLLIFFMLLLTIKLVCAQSQYKNSVMAELSGNAYWYSINYERQSAKGFTMRAGFGYYQHILVIPLMVGKVVGSKSHHFEISGGFDLANNAYTDARQPNSKRFVALTTFTGYRYQPLTRPFYLKGGFTPIWSFYDSELKFNTHERVFFWFGVGGGYRF